VKIKELRWCLPSGDPDPAGERFDPDRFPLSNNSRVKLILDDVQQWPFLELEGRNSYCFRRFFGRWEDGPAEEADEGGSPQRHRLLPHLASSLYFMDVEVVLDGGRGGPPPTSIFCARGVYPLYAFNENSTEGPGSPTAEGEPSQGTGQCGRWVPFTKDDQRSVSPLECLLYWEEPRSFTIPADCIRDSDDGSEKVVLSLCLYIPMELRADVLSRRLKNNCDNSEAEFVFRLESDNARAEDAAAAGVVGFVAGLFGPGGPVASNNVTFASPIIKRNGEKLLCCDHGNFHASLCVAREGGQAFGLPSVYPSHLLLTKPGTPPEFLFHPNVELFCEIDTRCRRDVYYNLKNEARELFSGRKVADIGMFTGEKDYTPTEDRMKHLYTKAISRHLARFLLERSLGREVEIPGKLRVAYSACDVKDETREKITEVYQGALGGYFAKGEVELVSEIEAAAYWYLRGQYGVWDDDKQMAMGSGCGLAGSNYDSEPAQKTWGGNHSSYLSQYLTGNDEKSVLFAFLDVGFGTSDLAFVDAPLTMHTGRYFVNWHKSKVHQMGSSESNGRCFNEHLHGGDDPSGIQQFLQDAAQTEVSISPVEYDALKRLISSWVSAGPDLRDLLEALNLQEQNFEPGWWNKTDDTGGLRDQVTQEVRQEWSRKRFKECIDGRREVAQQAPESHGVLLEARFNAYGGQAGFSEWLSKELGVVLADGSHVGEDPYGQASEVFNGAEVLNGLVSFFEGGCSRYLKVLAKEERREVAHKPPFVIVLLGQTSMFRLVREAFSSALKPLPDGEEGGEVGRAAGALRRWYQSLDPDEDSPPGGPVVKVLASAGAAKRCVALGLNRPPRSKGDPVSLPTKDGDDGTPAGGG